MNNDFAKLKWSHLADYMSGHDNNFNLLRFFAALLVLVTHSFALSTGIYEPLRDDFGVTLGSIAVDMFFITSGFLVTGSLLYRQNLPDFLLARALRILPGLWASLALTVLIVGLFLTEYSLRAYFFDFQTWKFLVKNAVLLKGIVWDLPGAFLHNPGNSAVNGSLWSLPSEVEMYLLLAALWLVVGWFKRNTVQWVSAACVAIAVAATAISLAYYHDAAQSNFIGLGAMFFTGAALYVLRTRVVISHTLAISLIVAVLLSALLSRPVFNVLYRLSLPYLVLYLALVPGGGIRQFNRFGDYSYGLYIYAFPVQQALAQLWPGINSYQMIAVSLVVTLVFAVSSWHVVEKHVLSFKGRFTASLLKPV